MQCLLSQFCVLSLSVYLVVLQGCRSRVFPSVTWYPGCLSSLCVQPTGHSLGWTASVCCLRYLCPWLLCNLNECRSSPCCFCMTPVHWGQVSLLRPVLVCAAAAVCYSVSCLHSLRVPPPCYLCTLQYMWFLDELFVGCSHVLSTCFGLCSVACAIPVSPVFAPPVCDLWVMHMGATHVSCWNDYHLYAAFRPV